MRWAVTIAVFLALCVPVCAQSPARISLCAPADATVPEGVWQMLPDGAVFAIKPGRSAGTYDLVVLDSPDYTVAAGTLMGTMQPTSTAWVYDASLKNASGSTRNFMVEVDPEGGRLKMKPYHSSHRLSLRRWAGYLFRLSVDAPDRPDTYDGAVRMAPQPGEVVFL